MDVIILAGGRGIRLKSIIPDLPKPMAPINGEPFLNYLLKWLSNNDYKEVTISLGYKWQYIYNYYNNCNWWGGKIKYSIEPKPLGTGGAIKLAIDKIKSDEVLIINGDSFANVNLVKFKDFHRKNSNDVSIAIKYIKGEDRYGFVRMDCGKIFEFSEKGGADEGYVNCGIYIVNKSILEKFPIASVFSFEKDFLGKYVNDIQCWGFVHKSYFIDIGIPEDYYKANLELPEIL